jgi:uncharacterized protein YkwD
MKKLLLAALAFLAVAGCAAVPRTPQPPDPKAQMAALESRIGVLIEEQRLKLDPAAKPLAHDAELARIARARAADMAAKNYLAHAAPNGDTSATLLMAEDAKWQGLLGENLAAQHYVKQSGVDVEQFAQRFLDEWMKSQPHRENLAYAGYDRTGVGAAVNGDTVYVAQLFASDIPPAPTDAAGANSKNTVTEFPSAAAASSAKADNLAPPLRLRGAEGTRLPTQAGAN